MLSSHPEKAHNHSSLIVSLRGEHGGRLPEQHRFKTWDFKLASTEFWRVCQRLQVWPTLDVFTSKGSHQIPRYMTWYQDSSRAVAVNSLDYYWDLVTWLFPLVPLIPLAQEGVQKQQIEVDSDLSGVDRSNVVVSVGHTKNKIGSNLIAVSRGSPHISQGV